MRRQAISELIKTVPNKAEVPPDEAVGVCRQVYIPPHAVLTPPEAYARHEKLFLRDFLSPWAQVILFRIILFHRGEEHVAHSVLQDELKANGVYLTRAR